MSFFCELFDYFKVDNVDNVLSLSMILGVGLVVVGKLKIVSLGESKIVLESKNRKVLIEGNNLNIKSISKGELVVAGDVLKIDTGEDK